MLLLRITLVGRNGYGVAECPNCSVGVGGWGPVAGAPGRPGISTETNKNV